MGHSPVAGARVTGRWKPRGGPSPACGLPSCQLAEGRICQAGKCDREGQRGCGAGGQEGARWWWEGLCRKRGWTRS